MKKSLILISSTLALAAALAVWVPAPTSAGAFYVEPCQKSILCAGLIEHFSLDESTDGAARFGAFMSRIFENDGQDVLCDTIIPGMFGACSLTFTPTANKYLWTRMPGLSGSFSIGFWFLPAGGIPSGEQQSILSWDNTNFPGTDIYLDNQAGTIKLCISTKTAENGTLKTACSGSVNPGFWHYALLGASLYHTGQDHIFVSLDGGTKTTTATTYWTQGGMVHLRLGQRPINGPDVDGDRRYGGHLDHLDFWSGPLSQAEITLLYNGGFGRAYPYDTD